MEGVPHGETVWSVVFFLFLRIIVAAMMGGAHGKSGEEGEIGGQLGGGASFR